MSDAGYPLNTDTPLMEEYKEFSGPLIKAALRWRMGKGSLSDLEEAIDNYHDWLYRRLASALGDG